MWTVVYIAANRNQAERIRELLFKEDILANIRPAGISTIGGDGLYEVMVLESEADEAHMAICQFAVK
ncbi:MAG TPA: hypothetical protein PKA10_14125 [Selenomonadales bacterium]|nr:hypothetical protein [Selenomonadales bacterium]